MFVRLASLLHCWSGRQPCTDHDSDQSLLREGSLGARPGGHRVPRASPPSGAPLDSRQACRRQENRARARLGRPGLHRLGGHRRGGQRQGAAGAAACSPTTPPPQPRSGRCKANSTPPGAGGAPLDVQRPARASRHRDCLWVHGRARLAAPRVAVRLPAGHPDHRPLPRRHPGHRRAIRGRGARGLRRPSPSG